MIIPLAVVDDNTTGNNKGNNIIGNKDALDFILVRLAETMVPVAESPMAPSTITGRSW